MDPSPNQHVPRYVTKSEMWSVARALASTHQDLKVILHEITEFILCITDVHLKNRIKLDQFTGKQNYVEFFIFFC